MLPLHGLRVLDLSAVIAGPYAAQWLADFGADVIKIEGPGGDSTRATGPADEPGMSAIFLGVNRSKRALALDLSKSEARLAFDRLLGTADVLLHNIRPQKLAKLGLDPAAVLERHPRLIYCGLHGFGEAGPYAGQPAYDDVIQGMSGLADLMARQGDIPRYLPTIAADKTTGLVAALSILAAVVRRQTTGKGGFVEVPMFETMVAYNLVEHFYGRHFAPPRAPLGYPRVLSPWRRPLPTADGHICVMPYTNPQWAGIFSELGRPWMIEDPRFDSITTRTENTVVLFEWLADELTKASTAAWLDIFARLEVPAAPVLGLEALLDDPHLASVGFFAEAEGLRFPGVPVRLDGTRPGVAPPPRLGEHSRAVLAEAGLSELEIDQLFASGGAR